MAKDIIKIPTLSIKAPGTLGNNAAANKMFAAVKSFFAKKK